MKILVFYVDKQYFNMVILFLRLRVRRELIIRRDGRAVEGTGLENRRCESIRGFESHSLRQNVQSASGFYRLQAFSFSPLWKDFSVSSLRDLNLGYVVGVSLVKRYAAEVMK